MREDIARRFDQSTPPMFIVHAFDDQALNQHFEAQYFMNSTIVTLGAVIPTVLISFMAAFAIVRPGIRFRQIHETAMQVLALTQVFERRVYRHFLDHLARPGTHACVRRTLRTRSVQASRSQIRTVPSRPVVTSRCGSSGRSARSGATSCATPSAATTSRSGSTTSTPPEVGSCWPRSSRTGSSISTRPALEAGVLLAVALGHDERGDAELQVAALLLDAGADPAGRLVAEGHERLQFQEALLANALDVHQLFDLLGVKFDPALVAKLVEPAACARALFGRGDWRRAIRRR